MGLVPGAKKEHAYAVNLSRLLRLSQKSSRQKGSSQTRILLIIGFAPVICC
jgi:hypothetical protein